MKFIRKTWLGTVVALMSIVLNGCGAMGGMGGTTASGPAPATGASARANQAADKALYQSVAYANVATKGPAIIILPGEVKSNNARLAAVRPEQHRGLRGFIVGELQA
jgi:hypothetical protein